MTDDPHPNADETPAETPAEAMERLATGLDGIRRSVAGDAIEFDRGGVLFAVRRAEVLSFRLRDEIVSAALQTPDTAPSALGPDWISLKTATEDQFTLDRAASWFESAWRLAGQNTTPA